MWLSAYQTALADVRAAAAYHGVHPAGLTRAQYAQWSSIEPGALPLYAIEQYCGRWPAPRAAAAEELKPSRDALWSD